MRTRPRHLGLIALMGSLTAIGPMAIDMYLPAFPVLANHFHATQSQVQLTLTACLAGISLGQLLVGPVSDALGRRRPLVVGVVAYTVASLACSIAPSIYALVGLRLAQGLGGAAGMVIARAVVRDLFEGVALARAFSLLMLVTQVAPVVAPVLGSQLLRVTSWPGLFLVLAGYGLVLLLGVVFAARETLPRGLRRTGGLADSLRTFRALAAERAFIGYAISGGLAFAAMFAYISGSSFVLQDIYRVSAQWYGVIFAVNATGLILANLVNSLLVGRLGPRRMLVGALLLNLAAGVGVLVATAEPGHHLALLLPPLFLVVASVGFVAPNTTALALANHPREAGTAAALLGMLQFVIGAAAAPLVGLGGARTAVPMGMVIAGLGMLANAVFWSLCHGDRPAAAQRGTLAGAEVAQ
ncbi:MAG: multidrug effflux MFS transporter [Micromonosporaceae bacterium]|nr:multidrug effflux MFS transporter [Micromonosporaceae bacterium]